MTDLVPPRVPRGEITARRLANPDGATCAWCERPVPAGAELFLVHGRRARPWARRWCRHCVDDAISRRMPGFELRDQLA